MTVNDDQIEQELIKRSQEIIVLLEAAINAHAALTATHGATGAVVGTTNTQTLTNKKFGGATDYSEFEASGFLHHVGDAGNYDDVYPAAVSVATAGANVPAFSAYFGAMRGYEFVGTALVKELWAAFQIYHSYEQGTNCVPHIHIYIPDDATGGIIRFGCEYHWDNVGDNGAVSTTIVYGTVTRAANAGISKNHILSFGSVAGTGKLISSVLSARIFRDPTDTGDTFGASVWLRSADVHIKKNSSGSRTELVK